VQTARGRNTIRVSILLPALWLLLALACHREPATDPLTGHSLVKGRAASRDGKPLVGLVITLESKGLGLFRQTTTDTNGRFSLLRLPAADDYRLVATGAGIRTVPFVFWLFRYDRLDVTPDYFWTSADQNPGAICLPMRHYSRDLHLKGTTTGCVITIDSRTGEPEPHPH